MLHFCNQNATDCEYNAIGKGEEGNKTKPLASFKVDALFRHNSTWQGNLLWIEKGQEAQFRSVLELLVLMDPVLSGAA